MYISFSICTASSAVKPAVRGVNVVVVTVVVGTVAGAGVVTVNTKVTGALIATQRALDNMSNQVV